MPTTCSAGTDTRSWQPPGKNCGACGARSCEEFMALVSCGEKDYPECPFFESRAPDLHIPITSPKGTDICGREYDFVLIPLPGEPSARKIIHPFRPDLVERWDIRSGDIVLGRPMGAGCPIQHVLSVIDANPVTGVLSCHTVGPQRARDAQVKDIQAYHVVGFEGIARVVKNPPGFGLRQFFLPSFCMMQRAHTGVVMMVLGKSSGLHVRVEDIRID
ncbi:(Fe-S)-binding protein [Methanolinea mesophila]|uniref:(Fe-S)-binding protein n=1 Tax=Methanolinea mesophila TaxID=547055 RepID=UPI001AE438E1